MGTTLSKHALVEATPDFAGSIENGRASRSWASPVVSVFGYGGHGRRPAQIAARERAPLLEKQAISELVDFAKPADRCCPYG
jgi:hypothetical protein